MRRRKPTITDPVGSTGQQPAGATRSAMRSVLTYAAAATLWIFTSDLVTAQFTTSAEMQTTISIIKGILFIWVTSTLLYVLIRNDLAHVHRALFQQRLLAQGASGLRVAENPEQAWESVAEAIREAVGADVAEVWIAADEHTLMERCSLSGEGDHCSPVASDSDAGAIRTNTPTYGWLWDTEGLEQPAIARVTPPPGLVRDPSLRALRAVPVPLGHSLGGAILLWSRSRKRISAVYGEPIRHVVGQLTDTLERFQLRADLEHSALYDDLTGLPNRTLLIELLRSMLHEAAPTEDEVLVLKLHIDLIERIEQSLGHEQADRLVAAAANRLSAVVDERDTLARSQTAEFTIVAHSALRSGVADYLIRIRDAVSAAVELDGASVPLSMSIGVLVAQGHESPQEVLSDAATALQRAQDLGRGRTAFFDEGMRLSVEDALSIEVALREALAEQQFEVVYQPVMSSDEREIVSSEALVRWNHPVRGQLSPAAFIPVAEDSGLIVELGHFILNRACEECATWPTIDGRQLSVSVNLSAIEFLDPGLVRIIQDALQGARLDPTNLIIEITETTLMLDPELAQRTLADLRELGVGVALDDFGTGYSSLSYLQRFDLDVLKIDASFVANVPAREDNCAIASAIIQMASALSLKTVAEGVETEEQAAFLAQRGADFLQGYLFSPPVDARAFSEMVSASDGAMRAKSAN